MIDERLDPEPAGGDRTAESSDEPQATPRRRRRRRRFGPLQALLAVLAILAFYVGGTYVQVWWASTHPTERKADAIVVLGAAQYNGQPSPALRNRLDHALALYRDGLAPRVVVTGGRQAGDRFTEATTGYNYLRKRGVPDSAIRKEVQGHTTYESLAAVARFLRREEVADVILVSGPAQSKRLYGIADDVGLRAAVSPSAGKASVRALVRETVAVSVGRVVGYRRLERLDHAQGLRPSDHRYAAAHDRAHQP